MSNFKQYAIYILIAIAFSTIGGVISHMYSSKVINSLQSEIDAERDESMKSIKDHQLEIDTINTIAEELKKRNNILAKLIESERSKRKNYNEKKDTSIIFINDNDSILNFLRNKLN